MNFKIIPPLDSSQSAKTAMKRLPMRSLGSPVFGRRFIESDIYYLQSTQHLEVVPAEWAKSLKVYQDILGPEYSVAQPNDETRLTS